MRTAAVPKRIVRCVERVLAEVPYALYVVCLSLVLYLAARGVEA